MDRYNWRTNMAEVDKCWMKRRWSLHEYYVVQEEKYESSLFGDKYRVEMAVSDASDPTLFVIFYAEMNKLAIAPAAGVSQDMVVGMEDTHNIALPQYLREIEGWALTFQQKLSRFNFSFIKASVIHHIPHS